MINKIISKGITVCSQLKTSTREYIVDTCKDVREQFQSIGDDFRYAGSQWSYNYKHDEIVTIEIPDSLIRELNDSIVESPRKFTSPV